MSCPTWFVGDTPHIEEEAKVHNTICCMEMEVLGNVRVCPIISTHYKDARPRCISSSHTTETMPSSTGFERQTLQTREEIEQNNALIARRLDDVARCAELFLPTRPYYKSVAGEPSSHVQDDTLPSSMAFEGYTSLIEEEIERDDALIAKQMEGVARSCEPLRPVSPYYRRASWAPFSPLQRNTVSPSATFEEQTPHIKEEKERQKALLIQLRAWAPINVKKILPRLIIRLLEVTLHPLAVFNARVFHQLWRSNTKSISTARKK